MTNVRVHDVADGGTMKENDKNGNQEAGCVVWEEMYVTNSVVYSDIFDTVDSGANDDDMNNNDDNIADDDDEIHVMGIGEDKEDDD